MHLIPSAIVLVALTGSACAESSPASPVPTSTTAAASTPTASLPPVVRVVEGAMKEIRLGNPKAGTLRVSISVTRAPSGVSVEARYTRRVNCVNEMPIPRCTTKYDVRRKLPESAFTLDTGLASATLRTTVEGKRLTVGWTGYGDTERTVGEYGAAFAESREAVGDARWGTFRDVDKQGLESTSLLYRRGYAAA